MGVSSKYLPGGVVRRAAWFAGLILAVAAPVAVSDGWVDLLLTADATTIIDQPGNYRVVADVTMTDNSLDCIQIASDDVKLDLDGHTLNGVSAFTGTAIGINQTSGERAQIRNGMIRRFAGGGVVVGNYAHVKDLRLLDIGDVGIQVAYSSWIEGNWIRGATAAIQLIGGYNIVKGNSTPLQQNGYSLVIGTDAVNSLANTIVENVFMSHDNWIDSGNTRSIYIYSGSSGRFARNISTRYYFQDGTTTVDVHETVGPGGFSGVLKWFNEGDVRTPTDNVCYPS